MPGDGERTESRTVREVVSESDRERRSSTYLIPRALREKLRCWFDLETVGLDGLWSWLETVLPLLPPPEGPPRARQQSRSENPELRRISELARDLVDCAGERARLTFAASQYYQDNTILATRVRALEAAVETYRRGGKPELEPADAQCGRAVERYVPGGSRK